MHNRFTLTDRSLSVKPLVCACALLCLCASAWSMDLLQAFEAAKLQDATLLASRAGAAAGRERLPQARAQLMPNVSFSLTQNNNKLVSTAPDFTGVPKVTKSDYLSGNQTLSVRQPVFRSYLFAQFRQAKAQVIDSDAALEMDEQNLAVRVSGAYFDAVLTHEQLALVLAQRAAYTTQLDAARKIFAAGAGTRTDVDEAQARLDMTLAQEIEARQNMDYTLRQLQVMVNQPIDSLASLDVSKLQLLAPAPSRAEEWVERAEQNSPELRMLKARVDAAREDVNKAQSGHHPTLDAVAQWSRSDSENVTNVNSHHANTSIGFQLNIPLYAGGYVSSQVRQALASQDHAEQALEATRRDLAMRVQKEFRGMTENIPKVRALEQAVKSSEQMVLSSKKSFQAGSRTVLDVLNAEQQRMGVLRDLAQARYMYLISKIRLQALVGSADVTAVADINRMLQH
jgi:outer membrane protein/protease secretion system outer membrane protein